MTREEKIRFNLTGQAPEPTRVGIPSVPSAVCPTPPDNGKHLGQPAPLTPDSFNHIPISELEHYHDMHSMDSLHRPDAVAKEYHRGKSLDSLRSSLGKEKFKSIYQYLKNQSK